MEQLSLSLGRLGRLFLWLQLKLLLALKFLHPFGQNHGTLALASGNRLPRQSSFLQLDLESVSLTG